MSRSDADNLVNSGKQESLDQLKKRRNELNEIINKIEHKDNLRRIAKILDENKNIVFTIMIQNYDTHKYEETRLMGKNIKILVD